MSDIQLPTTMKIRQRLENINTFNQEETAQEIVSLIRECEDTSKDWVEHHLSNLQKARQDASDSKVQQRMGKKISTLQNVQTTL